MEWRLSEAQVVGGTRPLDPEVPFAQARVVLLNKGAGDKYLLVNRYPSPEYAEGNPMTPGEWHALIAAGEAHELKSPLPAKYNGMLWLLGPGFPERDRVVEELHAARALLADPYSHALVLVCFINENLASEVREHLANDAFEQALRLARDLEWSQALPHAERAFDLGGISEEGAEERIALLALLYEHLGRKRRSDGYLKMALNSRGHQFYERTLQKYREFSRLIVAPFGRRPGIASLIIILSMLAAGTALVVLASYSDFPPLDSSLNIDEIGNLQRKLSTTILVYFMQFGFIAFEVGSVRRSYQRQSGVKNLVVFAISFLSYILLGWHIQRAINGHALTHLLDIAFNAGFASTVALIIANTITERGTILVNSLCSMVAAGIAYPCLAGLIFDQGPFAASWGFVDTAGGCVVHVLGGMFGLSAALWIGPRAKRRAWYLLGKVHMAEQKDNLPFQVIGAFFLWFGWLGFNSGNATDWNHFLVAFMNTNIGASAGGLVGLIVVVANLGRLTTTVSSDLSSKGFLREIASLERIVLGMMGGLVAVTANASIVKPWQALIEAMIGASVAIVISAWMVHFKQHLDDPLGAIATHGLAGTVGVLLTAAFRPDLCTFQAQLLGCAMSAGIGLSLASVPCVILLSIERLRRGNEWWLYGKLWRLTPYEQYTGATGTEFLVPAEAIERARMRVRDVPTAIQEGGDKSWIDAVAVLALSDKENGQLPELFTALDTLLAENYQGSQEEQTALAAIGARAEVTRLLLCVNRTLDHRASKRGEKVAEWKSLSHLYTKTLIMTISQLAESFAAQYRILRIVEDPLKLESMIEGFVKACELLKEIGTERKAEAPPWYAKLQSRAMKSFKYLEKLPWYTEILERHRRMSLQPALQPR